MRHVIHEFISMDVDTCGNWHDGDGLTAAAEAVTCPACLERQGAQDACPSRSARRGRRCAGKRGHAGLHHSEAHGVRYVWKDETSPELSCNVDRP